MAPQVCAWQRYEEKQHQLVLRKQSFLQQLAEHLQQHIAMHAPQVSCTCTLATGRAGFSAWGTWYVLQPLHGYTAC